MIVMDGLLQDIWHVLFERCGSSILRLTGEKGIAKNKKSQCGGKMAR
jgi:hypothetical protein